MFRKIPDDEFAFRNILLSSIAFINNRNDMKMVFSGANNKIVGTIICKNILYLEMNFVTDDADLPQFICDIYVMKNEDSQFVVEFLGSHYETTIICENAEIVKF